MLLPRLPGTGTTLLLIGCGLALVATARARLAGVAVTMFAVTVLAAVVRLEDRLPESAGQIELDVAGWVDGFPGRDPDRTVFTLATASDSRRCRAANLLVRSDGRRSGVCVPSRLRLSWYGPPFPIEPGMGLALTVRIRPPRGLSNPGGFDYERWLFAENIGATGYVRAGRIAEASGCGIARCLLRARAALAGAIGQRVDDPAAAALLAALGLGVRSGFSDRDWDVLARTGTTHLVAISGLHIGLVAVFAFRLLLGLLIRLPASLSRRAWTIAAALTLIPAAAYAGLAGFALPTVRALLMLGVAQCVVLSRRRIRPFAGVALAMLAIVATDPFATLQPSFWLSFGAVVAIVGYVARSAGAAHAPLPDAHVADEQPNDGYAPDLPRREARPRRFAFVGALVRVQFAVVAGLMPLTAAFFGQVSLASLPVNLVAVPVFSFVLVPAGLLLVAAVATGFGVGAVAAIAAPIAATAWQLLAATAATPGSALAAGSWPGIAIATAGAVWFVLCRSRCRWLGLLGLPCLAIGFAARPPTGAFDLTVLDVGHGLAVVVRTANHTVLFDTGPLARSGFDAGAEIVVPALEALSPKRLDLIVVSHGDADHAGGLDAVQRELPAAALMTGPDLTAGEPCRAGRHWRFDGVEFTVLHPLDQRLTGNDSSCVLLVAASGGRALLTGDIERRAEAGLVARGLPVVDVVVAPHHGSATSSTAPFVAATRPAVVVASSGYDNRWGFPRPEVVARWRRGGARVVTTGEAGAVTVTITDRGLDLSEHRATHRHYWNASSGAGRSSAL